MTPHPSHDPDDTSNTVKPPVFKDVSTLQQLAGSI